MKRKDRLVAADIFLKALDKGKPLAYMSPKFVVIPRADLERMVLKNARYDRLMACLRSNDQIFGKGLSNEKALPKQKR
jgi:hypothetical protein